MGRAPSLFILPVSWALLDCVPRAATAATFYIVTGQYIAQCRGGAGVWGAGGMDGGEGRKDTQWEKEPRTRQQGQTAGLKHGFTLS